MAGPGWDDPPRPALATAPVLSVEGFEGPLDWLLEQVRAHRVDLGALSILALVDGVVAAFDAALATPDAAPAALAAWSSWLVMAADLALLRSRLLLADSGLGRAASEQAGALQARLVARVDAMASADWLERRVQLGRDVFPRGAPEIVLPRCGRTGDVTALLRACLVALRVPVDATARQMPARRAWTQADAAARIVALLPGLEGGGLGAFLPEAADDAPERVARARTALASTFGAALELARQGSVALNQAAPWDTVTVGRGRARDGAVDEPAR